jgi:L-serine/L-threonine ammonia-lyase
MPLRSSSVCSIFCFLKTIAILSFVPRSALAWVSHPSSALCSKRRLRLATTLAMTKPSSSLEESSPVSAKARQLYSQTPLIKSAPLSEIVGRDVFLKLDSLQASGSFKDRGMAHLGATFSDRGVTQLISSSGGNAGLAAATVGAQLNMAVKVIVPSTTKEIVLDKLRSLGADVTVHGSNWNVADTLARKLVEESNGNSEYVSPYDNPLLWTGHSTVVEEVLQQIPQNNKLGVMVVSVGGGGLLCGVLEGLEGGSSRATKVIAAETQGAACFGKSWISGEHITLESIDSVASSLGALQVTPVALERSRAHPGGVHSSICTDKEAVEACVRFSQDHRILVEPACGAALAVAYSERLRSAHLTGIDKDSIIVLEVCGGSGVSVDLLLQWRQDFLE